MGRRHNEGCIWEALRRRVPIRKEERHDGPPLAREDDERRAERERRAAQLREAWRQRHPGEEEREKERQDKEGSR